MISCKIQKKWVTIDQVRRKGDDVWTVDSGEGDGQHDDEDGEVDIWTSHLLSTSVPVMVRNIMTMRMVRWIFGPLTC